MWSEYTVEKIASSSLCLLSSIVVVVVVAVVQLPKLVNVGEHIVIETNNTVKKTTGLVKNKRGNSKPVKKIQTADPSGDFLPALISPASS